MKKRLLLLSNSTNSGEGYLFYAQQQLNRFLGKSVNTILFIPFAGVILTGDDNFVSVTSTYNKYTEKVGRAFKDIGYEINALHVAENPNDLIKKAEAIVVGGGNTFHLLHQLYVTEVIETIREKINNGTPYIGWSAGANIACPTLRTTNDMPIIEPRSFNGLNLVPFQINPHHPEQVLSNHYEETIEIKITKKEIETRERRIEEFLAVNPDVYVVGLREGTMLNIEDSSIRLIGNKKMRLFKFGEKPAEYDSNANLDFLLNSIK
ncbi:dipeptidase PepE [Scytonema sp. NUACC26]|uniref:dipeptidase PepE n=1 Tax=Scytonema sp. NUACC26 TaxID=3140176 RepID=UPI0034DBF574